jgi:hypothetical protein
MKKLFLTGVAALLLGTGAAKAEEKLDDSWWTDCRHGWITKKFEAEDIRVFRTTEAPLEGELPSNRR